MTEQRIARIVLIMYVMMGFLLEVAHHDDVVVASRAQPAVTGHDCGTHEIHIPLDSFHPCLACCQFSQRVSTAAQSFVPTADIIIFPGVISSPDEQSLSTDYLFTGKRGPPLS